MDTKELRKYAEWYYTKFFPSRKVLQEKLLAHSSDRALVEQVMSDLRELIVEARNIESRVHEYASQGKTTQYISTKLRQKKFDPALIEAALSQEEDLLRNPETYRSQIEQAIRKGTQK